ncbi:glycosyltransferase [Actinomadura fulvescens]|uniref:Glycosyltransferase family 4 protein n=1 Tax=Actinomadura fulvescens TaxID=46160 RepID=A0ABN3PJG1_9ACTN
MAEPRDVFIVCNNTDAVGGLQRWAHHLARLLSARGHFVTLVGITRAPEPHDYGPDDSYRVVVLYDRWRPSTLKWRPRTLRQRLNVAAREREHKRTKELRKGAGRLSALFAAARPGAVVICAQIWAMEWVACAETRGLKVIGMSHESYAATRRSSRYGRVKEYFADVDRMLALTPEDADAWARDGMTNADHMPNPLHVSPGRYPTLDAPVVTCIGRLSYEKGLDMMLEAWQEVALRHPEWRLRLYGCGPQEEELRERARNGGMARSVEFRGVTDEIEAALAETSIFALPSRDEGLPMSVLEAMAYGLPTVAFDCAPGVRELITDGEEGALVPPGDTAAFAAALGTLMEDAALRRTMGARARDSVLRFHPDVVLDRWERLFDLLHRDTSGVPAQAGRTHRADSEFPPTLPGTAVRVESGSRSFTAEGDS